MSKIKNKIIAIIGIITIIIGIGIVSEAAYNVGDIRHWSYDNYLSNRNLYCMEHGQRLWSEGRPYRVISVINIQGNVSKDQNGTKIEDDKNAVLLGIVSSKDSTNNRRKAMWNFVYEWMNSVGHKHQGLYKGYASKSSNGYSPVNQEAENFAESIKNEITIENKTDLSNLKTSPVKYNNESYVKVGPFKWSFKEKIEKLDVYGTIGDKENQKISDVKVAKYVGDQLKVIPVDKIQSEENVYVLIPNRLMVNKISKIKVQTKEYIKSADLIFFKSTDSAWQNLMLADPSIEEKDIELELNDINLPLEGELKVIKVDAEDEKIKLNNVGFIIQRKEDGKYVHQDAEGKTTYRENKEEATEFVTVNGEKVVKNLLVGRYIIYETKNPNYGYEVSTKAYEVDVTANVAGKPTEIVITNIQKYIKLSGYVWLDMKPDIKDTIKDINELYKNDNEDNQDILMEGVPVRLKMGDKVIKETKTDSNGAYVFEDVEIQLLGSYHIEFEYDGLSYESVVPNLDKDNGSKAREGINERKDFNNKFYSIEGNRLNSTSDNITTGVSKDASGNVTNNLSYNKYYGNAGENSYTSKFINDGNFVINANTANAGYNFNNLREIGQNEIKNINLGVKERATADLAIIKDLANAKVTINGFEHTYYYEQALKLKEDESYSGEGLNVGIRFETSAVNQSYTRAIYSSDVNYRQENAQDRELKVFLTYKIGLKNKEYLDAKVNSILEYYDSRYELIKAGAKINEDGTISDELTPSQEYRAMDSGNPKYKKAIIQTNKDVAKNKTEYVYVQFQLSRDAVLSILDTNSDGIIDKKDSENTDNLLENYTEINSYTIFKDGEVYAAIDKNSNPGNAIPGENGTIEDDTDRAPALRLITADARKMEGKVFLDETSGQLQTNQIREGNGQLDSNEKGISGVKLTLTETSGTKLVYKDVTTGEDGTFTISNFIPGKYKLTYTWGDNTYTVEDYKGTIYKDPSRKQNPQWFKTLEPRLSDAIDNWETRKQIDKEGTIKTMDSITPTMSLAIEYDALYTASRGDKYEYRVQNVDFGIVERARQEIKLDKHVKAIKIVSPGAEVLLDAKVVNGKFEGQMQGLTGGPELGFVKVEKDKELLQGSIAYITYEMVITNTSEIDYYNEDGDYYIYGYDQAASANKLGEIVKIRVGKLNDYLDNKLVYDEKDGKWKIRIEEKQEGKTILVSEEIVNKELKPKDQVSVELLASKLLAIDEELYFNNEAEVSELASIPYGRKPSTSRAAAEEVIITTNTGGNKNYVMPIVIGITSLIIIGAGIVLIKKKILKK